MSAGVDAEALKALEGVAVLVGNIAEDDRGTLERPVLQLQKEQVRHISCATDTATTARTSAPDDLGRGDLDRMKELYEILQHFSSFE